jgi:hypothetical protein
MAFPGGFKQVTCKKCGNVAVAVSRAWAEEELASSIAFLASLSDKDRELYQSGTPTMARYEYCWCKNHYKNFRAYKKGDCPDGCTLTSIIKKSD